MWANDNSVEVAGAADLRGARAAAQRTVRRFLSRNDGATAVEFGIVAMPFFVFVLGIMAVGLQFFTVNALDHAVEVAARKIRTGEAQKDTTGTAGSGGQKLKEFKRDLCLAGGEYINKDCDRITVHVQSGTRWSDPEMVPVTCASGGNMTPQTGADDDALTTRSGGAGRVVLVTACYDWEMPIYFPMVNKILMRPADGVALASGGSLIQSVATFRTEPYE